MSNATSQVNRRLRATVAISLTLMGILSYPASLRGQSEAAPPNALNSPVENGMSPDSGQHTAGILTTIISRITPNDHPDDESDSKDTEGADSRGLCEPGKEVFVALSPNALSKNFDPTDSEKAYFQATSSITPTLYFYTSIQSPITAQFTLFNGTGKKTLKTLPVKMSTTTGAIPISLSGQFPLEAGKHYVWKLALYREGEQAAGEPAFRAIKGSIQQSELSSQLKTQLAQVSPLERVNLYAQHGYWFEAYHAVANLDLQKQTQGLGALASELGIFECILHSNK
ncbi:DUF928 domain-containing protein [Acaryochloris sp. IP29b_bin.137]|uniref:DUF928 domain-containing protein n=1 Tax=Acaryochloris sp. IP29b_bin.137 TaxID=2969217 RepID=UPI0026134EC4|nr:DUF928 domain-containing protein [Acaryochloris sp. IP29b_bin.137]